MMARRVRMARRAVGQFRLRVDVDSFDCVAVLKTNSPRTPLTAHNTQRAARFPLFRSPAFRVPPVPLSAFPLSRHPAVRALASRLSAFPLPRWPFQFPLSFPFQFSAFHVSCLCCVHAVAIFWLAGWTIRGIFGIRTNHAVRWFRPLMRASAGWHCSCVRLQRSWRMRSPCSGGGKGIRAGFCWWRAHSTSS